MCSLLFVKLTEWQQCQIKICHSVCNVPFVIRALCLFQSYFTSYHFSLFFFLLFIVQLFIHCSGIFSGISLLLLSYLAFKIVSTYEWVAVPTWNNTNSRFFKAEITLYTCSCIFWCFLRFLKFGLIFIENTLFHQNEFERLIRQEQEKITTAQE